MELVRLAAREFATLLFIFRGENVLLIPQEARFGSGKNRRLGAAGLNLA